MPFFTVETWIGSVSVCFQKEPFLLRHIFLPGTGDRGVRDIEPAVDDDRFRDSAACGKAGQVAEMIRSYFLSGRPIYTPWEWLFLKPLTRLQVQVLQITSKIPYGQVISYRDIAIKLEKPGAARFVGNTMASNPWPLLIPCHRVIRSDGTLGGFGGGTFMKKALLTHETKTRHSMLAHCC